MITEIIMPQMGESITEATIIKWHKKVGDLVKKDEIIFEITTDKVDSEIPSPVEGIIMEIRVVENQTVKVGTIVAIIESNENNEDNKNKVTKNTVDLIMPKMGESLTTGTILKWHKKIGDEVKKDEIILEISTDKVDSEIPSPVDGIIEEILFNENETVEAGTVIARIKTTEIINHNISNGLNNSAYENEIEIMSKYKDSSNRFYSPAVLNIARSKGLSIDDLDKIEGTGLKGRVTRKDVLDYLEKRNLQKIENEKYSSVNSKITNEQLSIIPIDHMRQKIMSNMIKSRDTSVHVTSIIEVDMSKISLIINKNKDRFSKEGTKLTYLPFITYATIKALKEFPLLNSTIEENRIVIKKYINLGIAVALEPDGLIVPNIKNADSMNIRGLAKSIIELAQKARMKKLTLDDITDGTFTITNYGVFGTLIGTPLINQPEVGILGVGAVTKKPVVVENEGIESIAVKSMMYLSLSHDHRLIDGMLGGKFLMFVKDHLEKFNENDI